MTTIYPCFSCPAEFKSMEACEDHIARAHGNEVQEITDRFWEALAKNGIKKDHIYSGYDADAGAFYIRAEPDVSTNMPKGYRLLYHDGKYWILVKKKEIE